MSTVSGTESTFSRPPRPTGEGPGGGGGSGAAGAGGAPSISAPSSLYVSAVSPPAGTSLPLTLTMSSSSPSPSSSSPSSSTSPTSSPPRVPLSLSWQLITFAVTLSLLLSVSCAILARNVVLRARERRLRAAVAAGFVLEPELAVRHGIGLRGGAGRALGERPVRWDAWMPLAHDDEKPPLPPPDWPDFAPVSVAPLPHPTAAPPPPAPEPPLRRTLVERIFQLPPLPRIPPLPLPAPKPEEPQVDVAAQRGVRVAVLVAMPAQRRADPHGELPEVLFGTSDVLWHTQPPP